MRKILALIAGYLAWSLVMTMFTKKSSIELKEQAKECKLWWKCEKTVFIKNFIETQKDFYNHIREKYFTDENKVFMEQKKEEVNKVIEEYRTKWEQLFADLKAKWEKFVMDVKENMDKKKEKIEDVIDNKTSK
jgi:hypothetical protein